MDRGGFGLEAKMQSAIFSLLLNIALVIVIFSNAELGKLLGLQGEPLPVSLVWPSSGFSLAALLLFGMNAWPGIFFGNLAYNILQLYHGNSEIFPIITAFVVSFGSLLQAIVGNKIMRKFASKSYFRTVKDVFIFLIPAGLMTCLIGATIGATALYLYASLSWNTFFHLWSTFWIGDTMGVYIFAPLLVTWTLLKRVENAGLYVVEGLLMALCFAALTLLILFLNVPLVYLYFPLVVWVAYRFGIRGATLAIFFIALANIIPFSIGVGPFHGILTTNPLLVLVIFLEALVATALIVAAVVYERGIAWKRLHGQAEFLREEVQQYNGEELDENKSDLFIKNKLSSLGLLTSSLAQFMMVPLKRIHVFTKNSLETMGKKDLPTNLETLKNYLDNIFESEQNAYQITKVIEAQSKFTSSQQIKPVIVILNEVFQNSLKEAFDKVSLNVGVTLEFEKEIKVKVAAPDVLEQAFFHLILSRAQAIKAKANQGGSYIPIFKATLSDLKDHVELILVDNGISDLEDQFPSFIDSSASNVEAIRDFNLAVAYDIITHVYIGAMESHTGNGFNQVNIIFPKN